MVAIASVVLTVLYGQTRILFAMSRDGLVPKVFAKVSPRSGTPVANTLVALLFCGAPAVAVPLGKLADATSIGTLFAFALVNVAVVILRRTRPDMARTFRCRCAGPCPISGFASCAYLMWNLDADHLGSTSAAGWPPVS